VPDGPSRSHRMKSQATSSFWARFNKLPQQIQELTFRRYRLWLRDPRHPSLHFKKVSRYRSVRITDDYKALGVMEGDTVVWFWVGTHDEYERMLK
jgi:hypothetical protein